MDDQPFLLPQMPAGLPPPPQLLLAQADDQVLRPQLYNRLVQVYDEVKVSNRGLNIRWGLRREGDKLHRYMDRVNEDHHGGEQYRIKCPYCNDHRYRLYINHMWGHLDPETNSRNLWLCKCYNANCLEDWDMRRTLYSDVWCDVAPSPTKDPVYVGASTRVVSGEASWPGTCFLLDRLPPDHKACEYLRSRGFIPEWLGKTLNVSYLVDPKMELYYLRGRIIIPVYVEGKLVGWQARYLGERPDLGKPPNKDTPKYMSSPGFARSAHLYNIDNARLQPFVVVTEGVTKVWRFGPEAVATFGKEVTGHQIAQLASYWQKIVVLLDPDAAAESEDLVVSLRDYRQVVEVRPPAPPDEMDARQLRRLVFDTAAAQGVTLR